ncbi:MAG: tyrosine-type recombinase/integrase [Candidatus Bathyarchaeia archaeon]
MPYWITSQKCYESQENLINQHFPSIHLGIRPKSPGSIVRSNILNEFRKYLEIDLAQNNVSVINHLCKLNIILKHIRKPIDQITKEDIRDFLSLANQRYSIQTYNCFIKTIRRFFRDFLGRSDLVSSFKFKTVPFTPKVNILSREDLIRFYNAIEHPIVKMVFHMYCVTGLRRNDVLFLMLNELDKDRRMIVKNNNSRTKHRWITFYNEELAEQLHPYLANRQDNNPRVFPIDKYKTFQRYWKLAQTKTGLHITPKDLRDWFTNEMLRLGVSESYIDAFLGHVPKSILSRHYIIYDPVKLKEVYEKANIKLFP